jgi:hypothetical protein
MTGGSVIWPAEANLNSAGAQGDELLNRARIVGCGKRWPEAAGRAVLVAPDAAVGCGHRHQAGGFVVGDQQRPEFAFALLVALPRHRPGSRRRRRGGDQRGECGEEEPGAGHISWDASRSEFGTIARALGRPQGSAYPAVGGKRRIFWESCLVGPRPETGAGSAHGLQCLPNLLSSRAAIRRPLL